MRNNLSSGFVPGCAESEVGRGWNFRISEVERLYYLCSENKGADQLRGYRAADLRLCYRICETAGVRMTRII